MPTGGTFKAHLRKAGLGQELALLHDGVPLPGSAADPYQLARNAAFLVYFIAGYSALFGVCFFFCRVKFS